MSRFQRLPALMAIVCGLAAGSAQAQVVISQVYGGGGNSGAPFNHDFVELFNRGDAAVSLSGRSIQYASASGTGNFGSSASQLLALPDVNLQPGQYFLVALAGGATGVDLPTADASGTINLSGSAGKVVFVDGTDSLGCNGGSAPCSSAQIARILDLVGFGSANYYETAPASATNNGSSATRRNGGCTDTNNNGADFLVLTPAPHNRASAVNLCSATPPPPPPPSALGVRINEIEGNGLGSPLALGTRVVTEGVVTARRSNGYFLQSAPGDEDSDPATAEGLFVFTGSSGAPTDAVVGNRLRVTGKVGQYQREANGYPLTQLTSSSLEVLATGQALPAPVVLGAGDLSPANDPGYLGRYLGMRVRLPSATVLNPTNAYGDLYVGLAGASRPAREPGVGKLDVVPLPAGNHIARFDLNPERLRVESTGLVGGSKLYVDDGAVIDGLDGVMYYDYADFTLLIGDNSDLAVSGGMLPRPVPAAAANAVRVGSYNIEFFGGGANVPATRLDKLTDVFCNYLGLPDVTGLIEIADLASLQRLADAINGNEFGHCARNPHYQAYLLSSNGTQRLGYLVSTAPVADGQPRVEVLSVEQQFADERLIAPDGSDNGLLFDRAPLLLRARVHADNGESYPLVVLLNHPLSLLDVNSTTTRKDSWGTDGNRSRSKRAREAVRVSELVAQLEAEDPAAHLLLIGDFNSFDFNDGYVDVLGIISGHAAPADQVLVPADSAVTLPLTNLSQTGPVADRYSYVFAGNIQSLDHALASPGLLASGDVRMFHARVNADFAVDHADDAAVPMRTSDHDPLVAEVKVPQFLDADLRVAMAAPSRPLFSGTPASFPIRIDNVGSDAAIGTTIDVTVNVASTQFTLQAPGWVCGAAVAVDAGSVLPCERVAPLAAGGSEALFVEIVPARPHDAVTLQVRATAASRSHELNAGDNVAAADALLVPASPGH